MACIPDESVFTLAEYKAALKAMVMGGDVREIQYGDKRTVFKGITDIKEVLLIMENALYGHCPEYRGGSRRYASTSKGIC